MKEETVKVICKTILSAGSALIWGEALAGVVSRPILAWRSKQNVNLDNVAELIDVMNQRICDLEEKEDGESK